MLKEKIYIYTHIFFKIYREMNKYHNGKIYEIVDVGYNKCYIGSTAESLSRRFSKHKHHYKTYNQDNAKRYCMCFDLFDEYGINNCKTELIENFESDTKDNLFTREGHHQQQFFVLAKQYREETTSNGMKTTKMA